MPLFAERIFSYKAISSGFTLSTVLARSCAAAVKSASITVSTFSLEISKLAISRASAASSPCRAVMRSLMASRRIIISSSTSSNSLRRPASETNSCCNCSNSLAAPVPDARRVSFRVIRETTCSTSVSARFSSRFTSLSSVSAAIRKSRALLALMVRDAMAASSGSAAALAFNDVVVKSKFWISRMER
ncbi:unannotated protein [freshwater metagenome]|uniref:Unannotated protein n=1 Tax=freshwater metagenome TaxID=449393 RepID=A0A6J6WUJ9_9ZZZZ